MARLEKELHVKEERWRLQDNERMRQYFNFKMGKEHEDADHSRAQGGLGNSRAAASTFQNQRPHTSAGAQAYKTAAEKSAQEALHEEQVANMAKELA